MVAGGAVGDEDLLKGVPTAEELHARQKPFARAKNILTRDEGAGNA